MRRRSSCGGTTSCSSDSTPTASAAEAVSPELRRNRILDCIHGAAAATTCHTDITTKNDSADTNPNDTAQVSPEVLRHRILHLIHGHSNSVGPISDGEDDATVRTTNLTTAPSTTATTVSPELTRYRIMCRIRSRPQSPTKKDDDSSDSGSADDDENAVSQRASKRSRYSLLVLGFAGPVLLFGGHHRRNPSLPPVVSEPKKKGLRGGLSAASSLAAQNPWEKDHLPHNDEMDKSRDTDAYLPSQLAELLVGTDGVPKQQGPHFTPEDKARLIKRKMQEDEVAAIRRHSAFRNKAGASAKAKTRGMRSTAGGTTIAAAVDAAPSIPEATTIKFKPKETTNANTKGGKTAAADADVRAPLSTPTNQQEEGRRAANLADKSNANVKIREEGTGTFPKSDLSMPDWTRCFD